MKREYEYCIYIMASISKVIYIGVTNNIWRRVLEHKQGKIKGFTQKYRCKRLVYYEVTNDISVALAREKQLKNWHREWKINLIKEFNPDWKDLFDELF